MEVVSALSVVLMERTGPLQDDVVGSIAWIVCFTPPHTLVALQIARGRLAFAFDNLVRTKSVLGDLEDPARSQGHVERCRTFVGPARSYVRSLLPHPLSLSLPKSRLPKPNSPK